MVSVTSPPPVEVGPKDIQSGVLDISRIANLTETKKLENCLDEEIEDSNLIFEAYKKLECSKHQLYTKIEDLLDELKEKYDYVQELKASNEKFKFHLMQLTQKHRTLAFSEQHNELESEYDQPSKERGKDL